MGSESDEIDAGWDEAPASAAAPSALATPSEAPAASVAPATPSEAFEAIPLVSRRPGSYTSSESLSPSEVTAPPPSVERSRSSRFVPIATVVALAAASIVWLGRAPKRTPPAPVAAAQPASEPVAAARPTSEPIAPPPEQAPLPPAPGRTESVSAAEKPSAANDRLELEPLVLEAPNKSGVTVRSVPDGAIFFEAGKRIGTGTIHVNVHDAKLHLTALLNGYQPLNFKVDGTRDTVTVRLTPVGEVAQPATESPAAPAAAR